LMPRKLRVGSGKSELMKRDLSCILGEGIILQSREVPKNTSFPSLWETPRLNNSSGPYASKSWPGLFC
jgi:hypothetical protein